MKQGTAVLLAASTAFLLGGLVGHHLAQPQPHEPTEAEAGPILQALVQAARLPIPQDQVHCEAAGPYMDEETGRLPPTRVEHVIASHLLWSLNPRAQPYSSFSCTDDPIKTCTWMFRDSHGEESWQRFLRFQYDSASRHILPASLECIDVP